MFMRQWDGFRFIRTLTILLMSLPSSIAFATGNSGITYHGRILNPDGTPLTDSSVQFKMQIVTPDGQSCVMYQEIQTKDLSSSQGGFAITINDGSGTSTLYGYTLDRVFGNYGTFTLTPATCISGSGVYTPNVADGRSFLVYFKSSSMSAWEAMPNQSINFVPLAIEAKQVAGFPATSLVRVDGTSAPGTIRALTSTEGAALLDLVSGVSTKYVQATTGGATLPSFSSNPSSPAAGDVWYDSTSKILKYYDGTAVQTVGSGSGSGTVTSITAGTGLSGGTITTSGTISLPNTGTAGTYTKVTTDAQGRVTAGAQITGSDITSGTIGGSTAINTTGNITTSGNVVATNVSSTTDSTINLKIFESTDTNAVTITSPAGLVSGGYGLVLPANKASVAGQVLTSDTSGNLSWTTLGAGTGTVTSVAMTVPSFLSVTGSPVTSSGTLAVSLATQNANMVFAGPSSGGAAAPTFRALASADIPNLDWSKITSGVPTTLTGYGITDAVKNAGNSPSLQQGLDASLPAAGTAGRLYVATDTKKLYRDNGSSWDVISASTAGITALTGDVSASGSGSVAATVNKVNGVTYPSSPSTNTVPVVTASNTITYEAVPNAALANSSLTLGSTSVSLGATAASIAGLTNLTSTTLTGNTLNVGVDGTTAGAINIFDTTSGGVTIQNPSNATAYNFNLPASAGTSGQVLMSAGGGSSAMTWGTLTVGSGGTGLSGGTQGGIPYFATSSTMASSAALANHSVVVGGGTGGAPYTLSSTGSAGNVLISGGASADPSFGALNLAGGSNYVTGTLPVANGGTGATTLTTHGVLVGEGTSAVSALSAAGAGTVLTGQGTSSDPAFSSQPTLGVNGSTSGKILLANGNTSGQTTTIQPSASTTTAWNFTLPSSGGTNGYLLQTDGSGNTSWVAPSSGTVSSGTANQLAYYGSTGTTLSGLSSAASSVLLTNSSSVPAWSAISNDTFTQYALLAGRSGGQTLKGGTAASENLTLESTSNATKGYVLLNPTSGNVGIGTTTPGSLLTVNGLIESKTGGIKFPDGSIQTTAGAGGSTVAFSVNMNNVNQTVSSNNYFTPAWSTKAYDTNNFFNTTTGLFTPTIAGYYYVTFSAWCYPSSRCDAYILKNGTGTSGPVICENIGGSALYQSVVSCIVYMNGTTDYLATLGYDGGGTTFRGDTITTYFNGFLVTASTTANTGSGTANYVPVWSSTTALGNSPIAVSSNNVGIGTSSPSVPLEVNGAIVGGNTAAIWSASRTGGITGADHSGPSMTWTTIPGLSITFTLTRAATVMVTANGVQRADNGTLHVGYRFVVDGTGQGDSTWGNRIEVSNSTYNWHAIWSVVETYSLAAGSHTIAVQAVDGTGGGQGYICSDGGGLQAYSNCTLQIQAFYQ